MLEERGIRRGIEILVSNPQEPKAPVRKGRVVRTYPFPSRWLVVRFEDGNIEQVEENQVTTMYEFYRKKEF